MASYRWTKHRIYDGVTDKVGLAPISMWWLARAAAEETLQGSPMTAAWLKLFRSHLSDSDSYWMRWRGDFAESAELRRAYSGLYGRIVARAILKEHLGFSRFMSLKRNGLSVPGAIEVARNIKGDIPDWLAWDDRAGQFVLGEAKGSLTGRDFLSTAGPRCVHEGKAQFGRVTCSSGGTIIHPRQWVAATRWVTDMRGDVPVTALWDPPVDDQPVDEETVRRRREAMTRAWLGTIAPGFGWTNAADLLSAERKRSALLVKALPGPIPEDEDWPRADGEESPRLDPATVQQRMAPSPPSDTAKVHQVLASNLLDSPVYGGSSLLSVPTSEPTFHEGSYVAAVITRFGIRPVRTASDFEDMRREQDRARRLEEPAMLVGIPSGIDPMAPRADRPWMDGAGIAQAGDLAVFDLRRVEVDRLAQE